MSEKIVLKANRKWDLTWRKEPHRKYKSKQPGIAHFWSAFVYVFSIARVFFTLGRVFWQFFQLRRLCFAFSFAIYQFLCLWPQHVFSFQYTRNGGWENRWVGMGKFYVYVNEMVMDPFCPLGGLSSQAPHN